MADPFAVLADARPNSVGLIQAFEGMKRQRLADMYTQAQFQRQQKMDARGDEEYARQSKARDLIAAGAKPAEVIAADPETGFSYATHASSLEKAQREMQAKRADDVGSAALYLSQLPDDQLKTQWDGVIDKLVSAGYTDLADYKGKPNREALGPIISASQEAVKSYIAHLKDSRDADERARHNSFMEGIAGGNLALSQSREARIKKWGPQPLIGIMGNVPTRTDDLDY